MLRSTFDKLVSYVGFLIAALLIVVSGLAFWGYTFANGTVHDQLAAQKITMPVAAAMAGLPDTDKAFLMPFAGQPLDNAPAAKAYADHYIQAHMNAAAGGKTYAEISTVCNTAKKTDPSMAQEATKTACDLRETLFMGDTLRSMLLTAYAFGTIGTIALWGFIATLVAGLGMLILSVLGLSHAKKAGDAVVGGTVGAQPKN